MTESADLKPCPFCGGESVEFREVRGQVYRVRCWNCRSATTWLPAKSEAIATWNRRSPAKRDEWVSATDRMPDAGRTILAFYLNSLGKPRRIRAVYIAEKTREAGPEEFQDGGAVYDETRDTYYWPAGWYERIDNWDDYSHVAVIEGEVTYWMEIPAGPVVDAAISKDKAE